MRENEIIFVRRRYVDDALYNVVLGYVLFYFRAFIITFIVNTGIHTKCRHFKRVRARVCV